MAIQIKLGRTEKNLFCSSKWWGDPDMPSDMEYPMMEDYPLTFICQIDCEDIAPLDKEGRLPHEGMLYFFAAIDEFIGYDSPIHEGHGRWEKGSAVVKYAKQINMETFNSCMMVDEDDQPLTEPAMEMTFSACEDTDPGLKLLGAPCRREVEEELGEGFVNLLQLPSDDGLDMHFYDEGTFNFMIKSSDLEFGNWKRAFGFLFSL